MKNQLISPQGGVRSTLWFLLLAVVTSSPRAEPYLPTSEYEIVQTIPDYIANRSKPQDLSTSITLASKLLSTAKIKSDPRAIDIALTALKPWEAKQTNELNIIRAGLLQYQHNFAGAIEQLEHPSSGKTPDPRALLLRANIHIVQGNYLDAERDCNALLSATDTAVSATCIAITHSLNGELNKSYAALNSFASRFSDSKPAIREWMAISLAEMAIRLGKDPNPYWNEALKYNLNNVPTLLDKSRWLIDNQQSSAASEILAQLPVSLSRDVLIARTLDSANIESLGSRFELAELADGENAHAREYAEFLLHVANRPEAAAEKALLNWRQQREPIDLILLSAAAKATGNQAARQAASEFRQLTKIEDARLAAHGGGE